MKVLLSFLLLISGISLCGQITGTVYADENGKKNPLPGASVFWEGTETGTTTNANGYYTLSPSTESKTLVVSFVGYKTQKRIIISHRGKIDFTLATAGTQLKEAEVLGEREATAVDLKSAGLTFNIDDKELRKAACCNLSESFETNATIDVSFADAVTGQKQIEMLGLAGKYALIQRENIPYARGLNASSGLTFVPGPFVESLQLTKGLSSVINGYESITGQINIELQKPETAPRLLVNAFGNAGGRMELNGITRFHVSERTSGAILAHASTTPFAQDRNEDGFADMPTGSQLNLTNRYHWKIKNSGWEGQVGFNVVRSKTKGGTLSYLEGNAHDSGVPDTNRWGFDSEQNRLEVFGKNGYVFKDKPFRSLGIIYSLSTQQRKSEIISHQARGRNLSSRFNAAYLNTIFQDIIGDTRHTYRTGLSFQVDEVSEAYRPTHPVIAYEDVYALDRLEAVPGAYFEYSFEPTPKLTLVSGIRADYNSYFKETYVTPRLNLRYMPAPLTTLRIGGGRGQRTPLVVNENLSVFASNRNMNFGGVAALAPEIGWNAGASVSQSIEIGERLLVFNVDAFYTWFETKMVTDLDFDPQQAVFLLNRGSRSFSLLSQVDYEPLENLKVRVAYKYLDAQEQFLDGLAQSYLIPEHRAFANLAYSTAKQWKFDLTVNWFGQKRLPDTGRNPSAFRRPDYSPAFFTLNAQINKTFKNGLEVFAGCDNLLNFRQEDPILSADNPQGRYFDTNFTWGPVFGRNIYAGLYYTLREN